MNKTWRLKRTKQCAKCPWKVSTNPFDIPNGYNPELHAKLETTIAEPGYFRGSVDEVKTMACHHSRPGHEAHCLGWLANQLGPGNNIALRLQMMACENAKEVKLDGEQHACFEDTLP